MWQYLVQSGSATDVAGSNSGAAAEIRGRDFVEEDTAVVDLRAKY